MDFLPLCYTSHDAVETIFARKVQVNLIRHMCVCVGCNFSNYIYIHIASEQDDDDASKYIYISPQTNFITKNRTRNSIFITKSSPRRNRTALLLLATLSCILCDRK